jgi:tetratricopeptide (TPR) repeat protein
MDAVPRQKLLALALASRRLWDAGRWGDSIPCLLEIVRLDPDSPHAHHDLGIAYLRCGRLTEAAACLQRAVDLYPTAGRLPHLDLADALARLARALDREGREQAAAAAYRSASRAAAAPAERQHWLANALLLEGGPDDAEQELRRLLAAAPGHVWSRHLLGHLLSLRGQFDLAAEQLTRAIDLDPERPFAFEELVSVQRMTGSDRTLIERMRALAERPGLQGSLQIALHFGLGKAFDDLGDPASAIRHFDAANRLMAATLRPDHAALAAHFDGLIARFSAAALERMARMLDQPADPSDETAVFIVGMPRSGSTLVEQVLSSHPAVGAGGELGFWSNCMAGWPTARQRGAEAAFVAQAAERYRALLGRLAPGAVRVTDKAPGNYALLWLIWLALPGARIIHCRRHPVDTCLSIYFSHFRRRHDFAYDRRDLVFAYRQYQRLMDHWRQVLPTERFTEVEYENLVADREAETRRLVAFCGLEWDDACLTPERNPRLVNTASRWQVRQPVYATSVARWRRYEPWLGELRELL